jgi:hypothetical protein
MRDPGMTPAQVVNVMQQESKPLILSYSPTNGQTIALPQTDSDLFVNITPSTDLAALSIVLPSEGNSSEGQAVRIRSSRNIGEITVSGATTVDNFIVMLNSGSVTVFFKFAPNVWSRTV